MTDVIVVIGSGSIGQAIARRVSAGKRVLLADLRRDQAEAVATVMGEAVRRATDNRGCHVSIIRLKHWSR